MKKKQFLGVLLCGGLVWMSVATAWAQKAGDEQQRDEVAARYAATITEEEMREWMSVLTSDDFEGRETGSAGILKAADFIRGRLEAVGIAPLARLGGAYFQPVPFEKLYWGSVSLGVNGQAFQFMRDFYCYAFANVNLDSFATDEVVFAGFGIEEENYNDYAGLDVKNKVVMVFQGEPQKEDGTFLLSGTAKSSKWTANWGTKVAAAKKHGAKLVLFIEPNTAANINRRRNRLIEPSLELKRDWKTDDEDPLADANKYANSIFISPEVAKSIVGKSEKKLVAARKKIVKTGKPSSFTVATQFYARQEKITENIQNSNILAFMEGSDPRLGEELVVVTAHYDHLGKRGESIYYGADDNGSGTSVLLEIADAFAQAKKDGNAPKRSVLVMWVCGEEKGLLGSEYYVHHPVFPLAQTVANVNVDMVGRVDKEHEANPNYVYVIGADRISTQLHAINEQANKLYTQLALDYKYNAEDDPNQYYYRSDHYNFAERGVPSIFYFNGTHEDYHQPTDSGEKIQFAKMETIGKLVFHVTWELANRPDRIKSDVPQKARPKRK